MSDAVSVSVLYVDPDDRVRRETATDLETSPLLDANVQRCGSVSEAVEALESWAVDCVVTEYDLPDGTGLDLVAWVRDNRPDIPCVLYTDAGPEAIRTATAEDAIVEYLPRDLPDPATALARLVGNVVEQRAQIGYPVPETEDERLAALEQYDIDDLDTLTTVDRLTELVANHFEVAVAFAGVVDAHEERFLACKGADWERMDREDTICTHALLEDDHLVVENVQSDARFADVDALEELDIRSYAGVPLTTPDGLPIGVLCLIHDETRSYSEGELEDLHRFADELIEQLELRRRLSDPQTPVPKSDRGESP